MSWEGYCWFLIRAIGVTSPQLIQVLQPFNGRFPNAEPEFEEMVMNMRRMGHILEGSVGNLASQLRTPPGNAGSLFPIWGEQHQQAAPAAFPAYTPPHSGQPWTPARDPWQTQDPWQTPQQQAGQASGSGA